MPSACRLRKLAQNGCPALGPLYDDLARVSWFTLGGPSDLWRSWPRSCGGPCENMLWRSWWNLATGPCRCHVLDVLVWKLAWDALGRLVYQDLVRSSAAAGPFVTISWTSPRGPGMKTLVKIFYTSLWEDLVEILVTCSQKALGDLVQVRVRGSSRGPGEIY